MLHIVDSWYEAAVYFHLPHLLQWDFLAKKLPPEMSPQKVGLETISRCMIEERHMVSEEFRAADNFDDSDDSDDCVDEHQSLRGAMAVDSPRIGKLRASFSLMSSVEECGSAPRGAYPPQNDNGAAHPVTQKLDRLMGEVCSLRREMQWALSSQAASSGKALNRERSRSWEAGKRNWHSDTWLSDKEMKRDGEYRREWMNTSPQSSWKGECLIQTFRCTWCHRDTTASYCPEKLCCAILVGLAGNMRLLTRQVLPLGGLVLGPGLSCISGNTDGILVARTASSSPSPSYRTSSTSVCSEKRRCPDSRPSRRRRFFAMMATIRKKD